MKPLFKSTLLTSTALAALYFTACKKETPATPVTNTNTTTNYSLGQFYAQNGAQIQTYTVSSTAGGSFTTPKGTVVTIPANSFIQQNGAAYIGNVTIKFKDIYTKSDMLLSNMPPMLNNGAPLKSGGEFSIKALASNGSALQLNGTNSIKIAQPLNGWAADKAMAPFIKVPDSVQKSQSWTPAPVPDTVTSSPSGYVFGLYGFGYPADSDTWCNSDNSGYFAAYTQVPFTIQSTDDSLNFGGTDVFLLFTGINSMVHVYSGVQAGNTFTFPYQFAPQGLACTVVAVQALSNGKMRCAFVPTTITANGTINFTCTPTTFSAFTTTLKTYNN